MKKATIVASLVGVGVAVFAATQWVQQIGLQSNQVGVGEEIDRKTNSTGRVHFAEVTVEEVGGNNAVVDLVSVCWGCTYDAVSVPPTEPPNIPPTYYSVATNLQWVEKVRPLHVSVSGESVARASA